LGGGGRGAAGAGGVDDGPVRAEADKVMDELRELWEARKDAEGSRGEVSVRWAWEVVVPVVVGVVGLLVLWVTG
ncbi:PH domain-containing protein, partial [Streptomyces sp. SID5606]|nr:PH domain-containing protein [Streptomyces sp. SID5606]